MRTLIAAGALGLLSLAGCGGTTHTATPASPTAAPSPTYDGSTLDACKEAAHATDPGEQGFKHASNARGFAELSDVPALREVAKKYSDADIGTPLDDAQAATAAITIYTWCIQHHVKS